MNMKKQNSSIEKRLLDELGPKPAPLSSKGYWKVLDGEWVWIPLDKKGNPLDDNGKPVLPDDR